MPETSVDGYTVASARIKWLTDSLLGKKLGKELPDKSLCIVPTIVQLALSKWRVREVGEEQADRIIAWMPVHSHFKCDIARLDPDCSDPDCSWLKCDIARLDPDVTDPDVTTSVDRTSRPQHKADIFSQIGRLIPH